MCGIAGVMNLEKTTTVPPGMVERMAQALWHRGPDEDGFFRSPHLVMVNRRLSIVGLKDGRQPLANEDGSVSVVYNGELFNYVERRAELQQKGHVFHTGCDTELLPHLWEDHDLGMLETLRGQFALALWDEKQQQLTLARDRFGICPLYWSRVRNEDGDWLVFASEIKGLLSSGLIDPQPDVRGINQVFTFMAMPGPVTCFRNIQLLLPGHYLTVRPSNGTTANTQIRPYWQMDFPDAGDEDYTSKPEQLIDTFEHLLEKAVERRLRADVPVVSYLSGGIDSSLVVAMATKQRELDQARSIPTFSIRIVDKYLDEAKEANLVANHVGARMVMVDCGRREVLQSYTELIRVAEYPVIDTAAAALLMLAKEVHAQGYKVALTGEGADEWLAGYPWYKAHKLLNWLDVIPGLKISALLRRAYLRFTNAPRMPWDMYQRNLQAIGGPNAWFEIYGMFSIAKLRLFSPRMWETLDGHSPYDDIPIDLDRAKRWNPLNRSLYVGAKVLLPGLLLAGKGDRVAMNSSVETRYPFLDEEVFAFCSRLPAHWKLRKLKEKYILRKVGERWLPRQITQRTKQMFRAPSDGFHTLAKDGPDFVDQLLSEDSLKKTGYFDPQAVQHWREAFQKMRPRSNPRVMMEMGLVGVIATQLWHHTYIDGSLADLPTWTAPTVTEEAVSS